MPENGELPDIHLMNVNTAKRATQLLLLRRIMGRPFESEHVTVLCLPGKSAWDIDYFLQKEGVSYIIGVERDPKIARGLRRRFSKNPQVEIITADLSEYLLDTDYTVDFAYLDYCSYFGFSVAQDIEILLGRQVLTKKGRCLVSFFNARENSSTRTFQRLLFEDLDRIAPSGEDWVDIEPDRQRCIAFNSLLHRCRNRSRIRTPLQMDTRGAVSVSGVSQWHRYQTVGGSMLTGSFRVTNYDEKAYDNLASMSPDKWYVRGKHSICNVRPRKSLSAQTKRSRDMGREDTKKLLIREIVDFYEEHECAPRKFQISTPAGRCRLGWEETLREAGLCPNRDATVEDIKGELRRIHKRYGVVKFEHLRKANIASGRRQPSRDAWKKEYGYALKSFGPVLDEMGIPHDLSTVHEERFLTNLQEWVVHLESGKPRLESPHYARMGCRKLLRYEDAVRELRRLQKEARKREL
jgi:hypothetical protein